jgi:hypothetical protein
MPVPIQCPGCGKKLRIPDEMLGRRVKCPACTRPFTAANPAPPPPPPGDDNPFGAMGDNSHFTFDEHAEVAKTPIPGVRGSWKVVRFGLRCVSLSMFIYLSMLVLRIGWTALEIQETLLHELTELTNGYIKGVFAGVLLLLMALMMIIGLIGMALCMAAPSDGGAKVMAILAFVGALISIIVGVGLVIGLFIVPPLAVLISPVFLLIAYASNVLFLFFLRSCAFHLQSPGVARGFMALFIFQILVVAVWIGTIVMLVVVMHNFDVVNFTPQQARKMGEGVIIAALILIASATITGLFSIVLYMVSVMRLSACIDRMMPRIAEV